MSGNNTPLLILDNNDDPSWFFPQDGHFSNNVLPPRKSNLFPPDFLANVATQRPPCFSFKDQKLKDLFEAKQLDKAILDSLAFSDSNPIGIKSSPLSNIDTLLRSIMYDFMIIDKLFTFMVEIHNLAKIEISSGNPDSPAFTLLFDIMGLAARTSLKASQFLTATFVANRVALRETVLDKFNAHESSRETLRGGSFASKNLFGPLPEQFKEKLNAPHGERFMFTLKTSSSNSGSTKRRGSGISTAPKKRKVQTSQNSQFPQYFQSPQSFQPYPTQGAFSKAPTPSYTQNFQNLKNKARGRGYPKRRGGYT